MRQDEAEKLARELRPEGIGDEPTEILSSDFRSLCDHILSGDMKREIENAAYERCWGEINELKNALRAMADAYERRVRTVCDADDLAKEPWRCTEYVEAERLSKQPFKLLFDNAWLSKKIAADPDVEPEAGDTGSLIQPPAQKEGGK